MPSQRETKLPSHIVDKIIDVYLHTSSTVSDIAKMANVNQVTISTYLKSRGVSIINKKAKPFPLCGCGCGTPLTDRRAKYKRGHGPYQPFKGHRHSDDTRSRISLKVQESIRGSHHYQKRFYYTRGRIQIAMRSAWEVEIAEWLDTLKIMWEYEPKAFSLSSGGSYSPDFYLPEFSCYVEVKGYWLEDARVKVEAFRVEYPDETIFIVRDVGLFGKLYLSQRLFELLLGHNVEKMDEEQRVKFIKEQSLMLYAEIAEVLQEVPWKNHKKYIDRQINRREFLSEWTDVFVFIVNILAAIQVDEFQVCRVLNETEKKNFFRQVVGYTGTTGEDLSGWKRLFSSSLRKNVSWYSKHSTEGK